MGYLKDFTSTLEAKLTALPKTERSEIVAFVAKEVLTSYRNGLRDAKQNRPPAKSGERSSPRRTEGDGARRSRRNYQHR